MSGRTSLVVAEAWPVVDGKSVSDRIAAGGRLGAPNCRGQRSSNFNARPVASGAGAPASDEVAADGRSGLAFCELGAAAASGAGGTAIWAAETPPVIRRAAAALKMALLMGDFLLVISQSTPAGSKRSDARTSLSDAVAPNSKFHHPEASPRPSTRGNRSACARLAAGDCGRMTSNDPIEHTDLNMLAATLLPQGRGERTITVAD
jgi:hypothetical protein